MTLEIISSDAVHFRGEADSVTLPGELGQFSVLKDHASIISVLTPGAVAFTTPDGKSESIPVSGGLVDVDNNVVSVCIY